MTALIYDERCLAHDCGSMLDDREAEGWIRVPEAERPERLERSFRVLERSGVASSLERIDAGVADESALARVHTPGHIDRIRTACGRGELVWVGPEARVGPGSWEPALLAAGGCMAAAESALSGPGRNAFALVRPPGHHSSADRAMGYCLFNNAAIAARHAQRDHGLDRVAIVDWDVHHGNGTQEVFYDDPSVLFVSLHQDSLYPEGSGAVADRGDGDGAGATINVPLPAGTGDAGYTRACEAVVAPALRAFRPELILVSAGQDPEAGDPLGRMSVTTEGFRAMTRLVVELADELCEGRLAVLQEGGYSLDHLPFCNLAIVEALAGLEPRFGADPLGLDAPRAIRPVEEDAIRVAVSAISG